MMVSSHRPARKKPPTNSTFQMMETLRLETRVKKLEGDAAASGKDAEGLDQAGGAAEIGNLRKKLEEKERDLEIMKKQSEGLSREYRELCDKYAAIQKQDDTPKKDK
jgi:B-cell receptor-associated protein 31